MVWVTTLFAVSHLGALRRQRHMNIAIVGGSGTVGAATARELVRLPMPRSVRAGGRIDPAAWRGKVTFDRWLAS